MNKSISAILIRAEERGESDCLLTLICSEGIIRAVMRGVRKKDAKLKFAAQPFAFCTYELNVGKNTVVTGAESIENLGNLVYHPFKFNLGCMMLECVECAAYAVDGAALTVTLLKCLQGLLYYEAEPEVIAIKFLQKVLYDSGFVRFDTSNTDVRGVSGLLGAIASTALVDLRLIRTERDVMEAALSRTVALFEVNMDCELKSKKGIVKNKR